ncbi:MAG: alpha/beta hydrolase [Bacteroidota bacterium]
MKNTLVQQHKNEGRFINVEGYNAFVYEKGNGEPVICFHGVPTSSFLYRKVIEGLAQSGYRGISFDILGLGLSDRPKDYDYSWTSLGEWCAKLINQLDYEQFHVILHDIGGPIGSEVLSKMPERVLSLTILNTLLTDLGNFKKPFPMHYYEKKGIGELLVSISHPVVFKKLMHRRGIHRNEVFGNAEAKAYIDLFKGNDGGKSFLKIMRSFDATAQKSELYLSTLRNLEVPKQIIWGINDKGLTLEKYGEPLRTAIGLEKKIIRNEGSHFLQEDYPEVVVENVIELIEN